MLGNVNRSAKTIGHPDRRFRHVHRRARSPERLERTSASSTIRACAPSRRNIPESNSKAPKSSRTKNASATSRSSPPSRRSRPRKVLDRTWQIVVTSTLEDVDGFVGPIFRDAMIWGTFVMLAMTGLSVSPSSSSSAVAVATRTHAARHARQGNGRCARDPAALAAQGQCVTDTLQIAAINQPATHISGDFYNWFQLDDGRVVVTIGDVTGHGMSAAFLMATTQLLVRNIMPRVAHAGECLDEINKQLVQQSFSGQFVTLLILVIDPNRCSDGDRQRRASPAADRARRTFRNAARSSRNWCWAINEESNYFSRAIRPHAEPEHRAVHRRRDRCPAAPTANASRTEGLAKSLFGKIRQRRRDDRSPCAPPSTNSAKVAICRTI